MSEYTATNLVERVGVYGTVYAFRIAVGPRGGLRFEGGWTCGSFFYEQPQYCLYTQHARALLRVMRGDQKHCKLPYPFSPPRAEWADGMLRIGCAYFDKRHIRKLLAEVEGLKRA